MLYSYFVFITGNYKSFRKSILFKHILVIKNVFIDQIQNKKINMNMIV